MLGRKIRIKHNVKRKDIGYSKLRKAPSPAKQGKYNFVSIKFAWKYDKKKWRPFKTKKGTLIINKQDSDQIITSKLSVFKINFPDKIEEFLSVSEITMNINLNEIEKILKKDLAIHIDHLRQVNNMLKAKENITSKINETKKKITEYKRKRGVKTTEQENCLDQLYELSDLIEKRYITPINEQHDIGRELIHCIFKRRDIGVKDAMDLINRHKKIWNLCGSPADYTFLTNDEVKQRFSNSFLDINIKYVFEFYGFTKE